MSLTMQFSINVLNAMKAREQRAQEISEGIESFITWGLKSHQNNPMPEDGDHGVKSYVTYETDTDNDTHDSQSHYLAFYCYMGDQLSTELNISVHSSGQIGVGFVGDEYGGDGQSEIFNSDAYSVEETVAKIVTLIQYNDVNDFGPLVTHTAQRMWIETLGNDAKSAPGCNPTAL